MFIPRYWSEASHREQLPERKQVTVRRFGWSSTSQEDADVHARQRVEEALGVLRDGGPEALRDFTRRERKVAYAGSDGLPIREEIVREWPEADVVLTRNSYGSVCLNTTRAMFVDVDRAESHAGCFGCVGGLVGLLLGFVGAPLLFGVSGFGAVLLAAILGAIAFAWIGTTVGRIRESRDPRARDLLGWAVDRARAWCDEHPDWRVVAYETPAGARLLPVHAPFDAGDEKTFEFMSFVKADPLYQRMCTLQKCFRARVSPKPWRAGVKDRFRAGGTWPVREPYKLAARAAWVRAYDDVAGAYASCRLVDEVGRGRTDASVEEIRRLHDEMCRAEQDLPLA